MNYRHAYHAGNFADVLKHVVLSLAIEHLKLKPAPFRVIDTHAGIGLYDLTAGEAERTGEWRGGIGRLLGPDAAPIPAEVKAALAPYLAVVASLNGAGQPRFYPGSPVLARRLLRPCDRLVASELHPDDCAALARHFGRDEQVKVLHLDGWLAVKSLLPPKERRGLVLIDPPYEARDELQRLTAGLAAAIRRFATGTFLLWYPLKDPEPVAAFYRDLAGLGLGKALRIELAIRDPRTPDRLNGCELLAVNPPWTLAERLRLILPFLAERLAQAPGGGWRLEAPGGVGADPPKAPGRGGRAR